MKNWIDLLACPECGGGLSLEIFEGDDKRCAEGLLTCGLCFGWYVVTNGIPRLFIQGPLRPDEEPFIEKWRERLPDHILTQRPGKGTSGQADVQNTFGYKWTRQSWWGMEGESAKVMEEWLLPRYGWPDRGSYADYMKSREVMLDAGCGLGREALRMAGANPNARVIGLELSRCVDEAARHAREKGIANVFYIQADLTRPPLRKRSFDFIISEGVLHHTPDTRHAFLSLVPLVSSGGELACYVYRKKAALREYADDYVRTLIQDMDPQHAWNLMEPLTKLGKALSDIKATVVVPEDVEVLGIKAGEYDVQRLIYYTMFKCYWNDRLTFDENVHINFDWYHPRYAWRHTKEEVEDWCKESCMDITSYQEEEAGITVRAKKR